MREPERSKCRGVRPDTFALIVKIFALARSVVIAAPLLGLTPLSAQGDDLATAQRLSTQVEALEATERYRDAIPLAEKVLAIYETTFGPDHPDTMAARGRLGVLYVSAGAYPQGETLLRRSFAINRRVLEIGGGSEIEGIFSLGRGLVSGRALLLPDARESQGYGLYSYLLFEIPPRDEKERSRYLKALEAYLLVLQPMEELERHKRRSQLNITLVPVKQAVKLPSDLSDVHRVGPAAEQVLAAYDYARAQVLLESLGKQVVRSGPYLLSSMPVEAGAKQLSLFLDMSHVAPDLVWEWTRAFSWLAAGERSWTEVTLRKLALNTRNVIAVAAKDTPDVIGALERWVRMVEAK